LTAFSSPEQVLGRSPIELGLDVDPAAWKAVFTEFRKKWRRSWCRTGDRHEARDPAQHPRQPAQYSDRASRVHAFDKPGHH
jgi:hypothetical protein